MGKIRLPQKAKLFAGFICNDACLIAKTTGAMEKRFGPLDLASEIFDFNFTDYYSQELGRGLKRQFVSFRRLIGLEGISAVKLFAAKLEKRFGSRGRRRINIDPGYITPAKLALLTTKDYYHRLYLGKGIYAEVTLYFKDKAFRPFEWTYPDYRSAGYIEFFNSARGLLLSHLRGK